MNICFIDNIPTELSAKIHAYFYSKFKVSSLEEADIVVTGLTPFSGRHYPNVKYIVSATTNIDHIEPYCQKVISLANNPSIMKDVTSTAEHTIFLILSLARRFFDRPGSFSERYNYVGNTLAGKTLGIIGNGRVGSQVANFGVYLGMNILVNDTDQMKCYHSLNTVLSESDFISIHASTNKDLPPIIGEKELLKMKTGAFLINTSRGNVINEDALISYSSKLSGIALDVIQNEHSENNNLKRLQVLPNIIITPHIGGCTFEDLKKTSTYCYFKLMEDLNKDEDPK